MPLHHITECIARISAVEREKRTWIRTWPTYCTACGARGGDWSLDKEEVQEDEGRAFDPCGFCVGSNKCPRCSLFVEGLKETEKRDIRCPHCHWRWGCNPGDVLPELPVCICPDPVEIAKRLLDEHLSLFQEVLVFVEQRAVPGDELVNRMRKGREVYQHAADERLSEL